MEQRDTSNKKTKKVIDNGNANQVTLVVPWTIKDSNVVQAVSRGSRADPDHFVSERSRVHEVYIRETEKTKRLSLLVSAVLLISASAFYIFAPAGREHLSNWVGAALLVLSAGAAGYGRVWAKTKTFSVTADQGTKRK